MSAAVLAGCAGRETIELVGYCSLDDPASAWVVGNKLERQAEQRCRGGYRVVERRDIALESGHEFRWTVDCEDPRTYP